MCASAKDATRKSCRNWRLIAYSPPDDKNGSILNSSSLLPFFNFIATIKKIKTTSSLQKRPSRNCIFVTAVEAYWMAFFLDEHCIGYYYLVTISSSSVSFAFSFLFAICSTSVNDLKEKGISISGRFCDKTVPQSAFATRQASGRLCFD